MAPGLQEIADSTRLGTHGDAIDARSPPRSGIVNDMPFPRRTSLALLALPFLGWGCAPPIPSGGFEGPDPASRIYAAAEVAKTYQATGVEPTHAALRHLVTMLVSSDPAERLVAVDTLRLVTGRSFGYRPYDPLSERRMAADRWSTWIQHDAPAPKGATS